MAAKEWIMVRIGRDTHERLDDYPRRLLLAAQHHHIVLPPEAVDHMSLDYLLTRCLDRVEDHQERARQQRMRHGAKRTADGYRADGQDSHGILDAGLCTGESTS